MANSDSSTKKRSTNSKQQEQDLLQEKCKFELQSICEESLELAASMINDAAFVGDPKNSDKVFDETVKMFGLLLDLGSCLENVRLDLTMLISALSCSSADLDYQQYSNWASSTLSSLQQFADSPGRFGEYVEKLKKVKEAHDQNINAKEAHKTRPEFLNGAVHFAGQVGQFFNAVEHVRRIADSITRTPSWPVDVEEVRKLKSSVVEKVKVITRNTGERIDSAWHESTEKEAKALGKTLYVFQEKVENFKEKIMGVRRQLVMDRASDNASCD